MQVTREDLQNLYQNALDEKRNEKIVFHFNSFDRMIQSVNSKGKKEWTQAYYQEDPLVLDGVVLKLNEKYVDSKIIINYTPLNIYNGTPSCVLSDVPRATLPINDLKDKPPTEVCPILNIHRCKCDNDDHSSIKIDWSI